MNADTYYRKLLETVLNHVKDADMFLVQSAVTCCALFWLLHRAWLTLWKPVPELISILGVEVPDSPAVSLAGIKADAITLHWTRPEPNKTVLKYLIQVNGVNVGESSRLETAITVTGLKPGHFYNVRVIAVGPNNFQAGSSVIRLQTHRRDGRLQLQNGQIPSNPYIEGQQGDVSIDDSDEQSAGQGQAAGIETVAIDTPTMNRDPTTNSTSSRRNTGGRRHSPSNVAAEQAALARRVTQNPEESMQQLTVRFDAVRKDIAEVSAQSSKDTTDHNLQRDELVQERERVRKAVEEKEKTSEALKKDLHNAERANRQAQTRKAQKEKVLQNRESEKNKMHDDTVRWRKEIAEMGVERENWRKEMEKMAIKKETKSKDLQETILTRQSAVNALEEEIRVRGLQIIALEEERKSLPGAQDDEDSRERDAAATSRDVEWEIKEKALSAALHDRALTLRQLEAEYHSLLPQWQAITARHQNSLMYHANSSGVDFDQSNGQGKATSRRSRQRKSRTSTVSSQVASYAAADSSFPGAGVYNNTASPSFAPGPYFDLRNDGDQIPLSEQLVDMTEAERQALTAGAQLSPTATSLLPSNIFEGDDEPPSPRAGSTGSFGPALYGPAASNEFEPQSPGSSSRSASLLSSPQTSSQNLAKYGVVPRDYGAEGDHRSLRNSPRREFGAIDAPSSPMQPPSFKGLSNIFAFPRARGKTTQVEGPPLGSLKQGQSQSFPRSTEEPETISNRSRRISFSSSWNVMPSLFNRSSTTADSTEGNGPAPARNAGTRRRRGFNVFGSSIDDQTPGFPDRDPSSPRPLSIASSDLPRPSTDSAPFGWPAADGNLVHGSSRLNTDWSTNMRQTWSSRSSRRPSIQHGSTTALHNGLASADDEILPPDTLLGQSSPAGVIGTRPPSSHKPVTPRLNPAAPTFTFSFRSKAEKGKSKEKSTEASIAPDDIALPTNISSPAESRKSRDTPSIRTQASMAESHESLERTSSNTYSDMASASATSTKEKESSFRQLLRKGSSSKFSLSSIRGKDSGLFGGKKGPSSATNSDRNASVERDASFDEFGEDELSRSVDSATNSPMIGSLSSSEWKSKEPHPATPKEGRKWSRFGLKGSKTKARESLDVDRSEAETTGTEDEGIF